MTTEDPGSSTTEPLTTDATTTTGDGTTTMGSFIVIDEVTNATVGAGMIREAVHA